jgi:hypothetical protein
MKTTQCPARGAASTVLVKSAVPTGDITFDEGGGVATFFAERATTESWRDNRSAKIENFQYRITADAGVTYRFFPVPGNGRHNVLISAAKVRSRYPGQHGYGI